MDRLAFERRLARLQRALSELRPPCAREKRLMSIDVTDRIDRWGNYRYVDPRAEDVLGFPPSYYANENDWVAFNHPEDIWRTDILWQRAMAGYPVRAVEYRTDDSDGHWVWLEDSFRPAEVDPFGRILVVEGRWRDITPRKRREIEFLIRQFELALRLGRMPEHWRPSVLIPFPGPVAEGWQGRRPACRPRRPRPTPRRTRG